MAVIVSRYPAVSHSFIVNEVRALRERGIDVHTFSVRRPGAAELLSPADREEHARTFHVLPPRPARLAAAHAHAALTRPVRYLGALREALRLSGGGARAALWSAFHFAEAILVWDECRRRGVTRLHAHFANVGSDLALLAARFGGEGWSWSLTMHGCTELFDETPHRLPVKLRSAALVVCNSDFTRAQLMKLVEPDAWGRLHVVRCGIDPSAFRGGAEKNSEKRDGSGPLRVLTVARLVPGKGHAVLLRALVVLRDKGIATAVTFAGDGPERARLERQARDLELDVRFAGAVGQDELPAYLADAQVFCLPTFAEGLGVALIEAMAAGLAVVSTLVMGVPEVVRDGETGLLVSPGRSDLLASALARLAREPELRERMGLAGAHRAREEFDIERSASALAALHGGRTERSRRKEGATTPRSRAVAA